MKERTGTYGRFYGCKGYPKCKFTFDLRGKGKTKEKKPVKKLVLPEGYGFNVTGKDILNTLTTEGKNLRELIDELKITDEKDERYIKLKLKEFENKNMIKMETIENEKYWKIST